MSDVGPGSSIVPQPEDGEFSELLAVLRDSRRFLPYVLTQVDDVVQMPRELREAIRGTQAQIAVGAEALVIEIQSGDYDTELHAHSLGNSDPAWRLKYVGYRLARTEVDRPASPAVEDGQRSLRRYLRLAKRPMRWLNVMLGSLADVIPGAGGVYKELKESTEAVVDDALEVTEP